MYLCMSPPPAPTRPMRNFTRIISPPSRPCNSLISSSIALALVYVVPPFIRKSPPIISAAASSIPFIACIFAASISSNESVLALLKVVSAALRLFVIFVIAVVDKFVICVI